ncbi:MAG: hypothetical protein WCO60_10705 [Verrucomicrobiota bacterium]
MSKTSNILSVHALALGSTLLLPALGLGDVVTGDYEARLENGTLVQITVAPAVTSTPTTRTFSGKVIASGVSQTVTGKLISAANDGIFSGTLSTLKGVAPISLQYTLSNTALSVTSSTTPSSPVAGLLAFKPATGQTMSGVHVFAHRSDLTTQTPESIQTEITAIDSQLQAPGISPTQTAELTAQRLILVRKLSLTKFQGYGSVTLTFAGAATGSTAALAGVAPDGTKWTYSSKLRVTTAAATSGSIYFNALSGKLPMQGQLSALQLDNLIGKAILPSVGSDGASDELNWDLLKSTNTAARPIFATTTANNIFGGTVSSTFLAKFGDKGDGESFDGFGALLTKTNTISKLLLARKNSSLSILTSGAASFSGKFSYVPGTTASAFSGVLIKAADGTVTGYGSILLTPTTSLPVTLKQADLSGDITDPFVLQPQDSLGWKGLASSTLQVQLDTPGQLNLTTVNLVTTTAKGAKVIVATAEATLDGFVTFNLGSVASGTYSIEATRSYVKPDGVVSTKTTTSESFRIDQKISPAGTFQANLSYGEFATNPGGVETNPLKYAYDLNELDGVRSATPDGNAFRARLTITSTASGTFSGKVELVDLRTPFNEEEGDLDYWLPSEKKYPSTEQPSETDDPTATTRAVASPDLAVKVPVVLTIPISGTLLSTPDSSYPEKLSATVKITPTKTGPTHTLSFSIVETDLESPIDSESSATKVPVLSATLKFTDPDLAVDAAPINLTGSGMISTTGAKAATGKYITTSTGLAWETIADSFVWDYSGSSAAYVWKTRDTTFTGSASVARNGAIAFIGAPKAAPAGTLSYTEKSGKAAKSLLTKNFYSFMNASLRKSSGVYSINADSLLFVTGSILESTKLTETALSGFRYNKAWELPSDHSIEAIGGFAYAELMLSAFRPTSLTTSDKIVAEKDYTLVLSDGETPTEYPSLRFTTPVAGPKLDPTSLVDQAVSVVKTLSASPTTGLFTGSVRLPNASKDTAITGTYVKDNTGAEPDLVARGASADGKLVWSLRKAE